MRSSFYSPFGATSLVPFAAVDPSIISSAIQAGGAIATTAISAASSAKASKKKKKKKVAQEAAPETAATTPPPTTGGVPSWALWAGVGALVLVGGFLVLRRSNAKAGR